RHDRLQLRAVLRVRHLLRRVQPGGRDHVAVSRRRPRRLVPRRMMRVAAVVERAWDPASIEVGPVDGAVDWSRAVAEPSPGSLEAVELALRLGAATACG